MKKGLSIIISIAMIFAFVGVAMADDANCVGCVQKNVDSGVRNIICPAAQQAVNAFDYNESTVGDGYCTIGGNEVVIDICSCPDACVIQEGYVLGVKIEILTPAVYWALDTNVSGGTNGANPANNKLDFRLAPKTNVAEACNTAYNRQFNTIGYYRSSIITDANLVRPVAAGESVTAKTNDAKVISLQRKAQNGVAAGYIITSSDTLNKRCQMRVDIPKMILNSPEYKSTMAGQPINIRVSIYTEAPNTASLPNVTNVPDFDGNIHATLDEFWNVDRYLCPDCYDPCGCTVTVANFCCDEVANNGLLFPYFAPDNDESYFWNGIVVNNLSQTAGTATFWIYEQDGDLGKATATVNANGIYLNTISGLAGVATLTKTGTGDTAGTLGNSKAYVVVCTSFDTDGFAMLSDRGGMGESMGYLPRNAHLLGGVPTVCGN